MLRDICSIYNGRACSVPGAVDAGAIAGVSPSAVGERAGDHAPGWARNMAPHARGTALYTACGRPVRGTGPTSASTLCPSARGDFPNVYQREAVLRTFACVRPFGWSSRRGRPSCLAPRHPYSSALHALLDQALPCPSPVLGPLHSETECTDARLQTSSCFPSSKRLPRVESMTLRRRRRSVCAKADRSV